MSNPLDDDLEHEANVRRHGGYSREPTDPRGPQGTPGRGTLTSRLPASARAVARAITAELDDQPRGLASGSRSLGVDHDEGDVHEGAGSLISRGTSGGGQRIPEHLRGQFEQSLGLDLGGVRVHTGGAAAESSAALGARAFAVGQDVVLGAGQYAPETPDGAWLLAHEIAHTVQQRDAVIGPQTKLEVTEDGDAMEGAADAAANAMMNGRAASPGTAHAGIARIPHDAAPHAPGVVTPAQQHALDVVRHGGRTLHSLSRDRLLELTHTISAAWFAAPAHSDNRRATASALVRLYDAMDQHLDDEFTRGGDPMMAWEIADFNLIDPWVQDAGEPSHRRHLPHRRHRPPVQDNPPHPTPTVAPPSDVPIPDRIPNTQGPEAPHQPGVLAHGLVDAVEFLATVSELALHSLAGGLLAASANALAAFMSIHSGDEFREHITEAQRSVFDYCSAFAHAVRGEAGGSGRGAPAAAAAAAQLRQQYVARGGDPNILHTTSFIRLYGLAWLTVIERYTHELETHLSPGFATTNNSRATVRAHMMETRIGGLYYNAHGGQ